MPIIQSYELHKFQPSQRLHKGGMLYISRSYRQPYYEGDGVLDTIISTIKNVATFAKNNPDLVKSSFNAVGTVGNAASSISKAVESSNELKKLYAIKNQVQKNQEQKPPPLSEETKAKIAALASSKSSGSGLTKF
jgi:hypothetical protein